nr:uncharacterized protein LOC115124072 isoform X2 [Oncorhynchus nerka]
MALRTAGSVLVVFLWSVTVVLGQDGWSVRYTTQSICTLKGSSVDLFCSYTYPRGKVTTTFWFTKMEAGIEPKDLGQDPEYAGRLEYHGDKKKDCTLTITDLRERDSATYKFRLLTDQEGGKYSGSPGVTLSVTGLQVKVTGGHQDKTLTCSTTCTLTDNSTYIWYKNGQHLDESTSPQYKYSVSSNYDASYSCAVKGHEDLHSPAVCVQGQSCNRVTYTKRRICVLKGSTVDISCTYVGYYSTTSSFWFRSDKSTPEDLTTDPGYAGRVEYTGTYRGPSSLRITDLREEDSAEYRFTFKTDNFEWGHSFPGTTLSVTGLQVKVTPAAEGQKTLTCSTTCTLTDNPTYIWYKNGQHLDESTSPQYKDSVSSNYEDSYSCAVKGHEDLHSPAVCVQGQSCYRVIYTKRRICVLKESTLDISCSYVGYYYTISSFWFRSDKSTPEDLTTDPGYAGRVEYTGTYRGPFTLRITDLREEDSAEYRFTFKTNNFEWGHSFPGTTLFVTGLQLKLTPAAERQKTLTCITTCTLTDNPTYIWYKNGQRLDESTSPQYKDPVSSNYGDSYSCAVKGHEDLHSPAVCVRGESCMNVTYTHQSICALKGSTVDISCFYTHPSWHNVTEVSWFNKWESGVNKDLSLNPEYADRVEYHRQTEKDSTLRITDLREEDSAEYRFTFKTNNIEWGHSFTGTTLSITDLQVKVTPGTVTEGSWVILTCSTTCTLTEIPNPTYIWYKNGEELFSDSSPQYQYSVSRGGSDSYSCALIRGHDKLSSPEVTVDTSSLSCLRVTYTSRGICSLIPSVDLRCTTIYPTDLQVKVTPDTEAGKRTLTCSTTCTLTGNPTYIWYRNGQSLAWLTSQQHSVWSSETESYSCAVKGHEDLRSPAVCVQGHNCWRVTYTKRRICVLKGSTVDISCSYTHPTSYIDQGSFWFTQKHPVDVRSYPESAGRVQYNRNTENHHTMTITHLTEKDSAEYIFRLITTDEGRFSGLPGVMLTVTDILLEMDPTSVSEGERVTLRCRTQCTVGLNPTYIWYKNGQSLTNPVTSYNSLILDPVSSEDAGNYSCAVEGLERILSPEETLTVRYGPKNTSVSVSPSGEIVEGSSVTLTCSSDANPPVDKSTWYKKNVTSPKASGQSYSITNIISEDRGEYYCEAENKYGRLNSSSVFVDVQSLFLWVPVMGVGAVLTVGALLVTIYCYMKRRHTGGSDGTADRQSVHPDPNSDIYTSLNMKTRSPEYDTLANVRDLAVTHRGPQIDAEPSDYENLREPPQNLD